MSESVYPGFKDLQDCFDNGNNFDWGKVDIWRSHNLQSNQLSKGNMGDW